MPKTLAGLVAWSVTDQRRFQKGQLECFHFSQWYWHELLTIKADRGALGRVVPVCCLCCFGPVLAEGQGNKKSCLALALKTHSGLPLPIPLQRALLALGFNRASTDLTRGAFLFCNKTLTAQKAALLQIPACLNSSGKRLRKATPLTW